MVVFVRYDEHLFAFKEVLGEIAGSEFRLLKKIDEKNLPTVKPVGFANLDSNDGSRSILITRYLENSIPYRSLFMSKQLVRYSQHLLDSIAGLLVQLHLAGVYWGDCSLSNALFRRDAGKLQAYLVDAETSEIENKGLPPSLRFQDLTIMEQNIDAEIAELKNTDELNHTIPPDTGSYIRLKYQRLWDEINCEGSIKTTESYLIQERIRALNSLGFSVGDVELFRLEDGNQLRFHVIVTDRNFHRNQLIQLTGLHAEEMQARTMMNEIHEVKAVFSQSNNRVVPLQEAAQHWKHNIYDYITAQLTSYVYNDADISELYCQILENKWYMSERAHHDVGHQIATDDFVQNHLSEEMKH